MAELYAGVLGLIALARDGHTDAYSPESSPEIRAAVQLKLVSFPDGLPVIAASPEYEHLVGGEVLVLEGTPAAQEHTISIASKGRQ